MGRRRIPKVESAEPIDSLLGRPVVAVVDLHGLDAKSAELRLEHFLMRVTVTSPGLVVRVITGRGNRSDEGSVLLPLVGRLLDGRLRRYAGRYRMDTGGGAYLVQLEGATRHP
jgi:DNA-nicking Smr family endonuclease